MGFGFFVWVCLFVVLLGFWGFIFFLMRYWELGHTAGKRVLWSKNNKVDTDNFFWGGRGTGKGVLCNLLVSVDCGLDYVKGENTGSVFLLCQPLSQKAKHKDFPEETFTDLWENGVLVSFSRCWSKEEEATISPAQLAVGHLKECNTHHSSWKHHKEKKEPLYLAWKPLSSEWLKSQKRWLQVVKNSCTQGL